MHRPERRGDLLYEASRLTSTQRPQRQSLRHRIVSSFGIAMHSVGRKSGEADGDIFRASGTRRGVANPFTSAGDDGSAGAHFDIALLVLYANCALQHNCVFIKFGSLSGFLPPFRTAHMRDANG